MTPGKGSLVAKLRKSIILITLMCVGAGSLVTRSHAEWWKLYTPKDFEDCSSGAEQPGLTKDAQLKIISDCDAKFSGRRKAGGGYTYFDFMQNRHFDIAGPNPTQEELRRIDREYLGYLEEQRKTAIVAALVEKKPAPPQIDLNGLPPIILQQPSRHIVSPKSNAVKKQEIALRSDLAAKSTATDVLRPPADVVRVRKTSSCKDSALSCSFAKLTTTMKDVHQALLHPSAKRDATAQR